MNKDKAPAPADEKPVRATVVTVAHATGSNPAMLIDGPAPSKGDTFAATLANGVTYQGIVAATKPSGGKTLVTFANGIAPQE